MDIKFININLFSVILFVFRSALLLFKCTPTWGRFVHDAPPQININYINLWLNFVIYKHFIYITHTMPYTMSFTCLRFFYNFFSKVPTSPSIDRSLLRSALQCHVTFPLILYFPYITLHGVGVIAPIQKGGLPLEAPAGLHRPLLSVLDRRHSEGA
jgi:hypothetical protein